MIRVLGLVPYPVGHAPGQRYRIEQWAPRMAPEGVALEFAPFLPASAMTFLHGSGRTLSKMAVTVRGYLRRWLELGKARRYDAAFVYREAAFLGTAFLDRAFARRTPLVFDFDDAIYLPASSEPNRLAGTLKHPGKTAQICRVASHVTVGNDTLASFARNHARQVTVIPSTIDTDWYVPAPRADNPRPVVGWSGSVTTLPYLVAQAGALRELRSRVDFRLRLIGARAGIEGLDVESVPWRAETEVEDLRPLDVGLMPLTDDEWSRGKCGLKALQYMALGIPPVVSPVGVNARIVQDGVNGFHARDDREWVEKILLLLSSPELRARLGAAARQTVEREYSARVQAPRMAQVFREVTGR